MIERPMTDPIHPTGRCTCAAEGRCSWCRATCHGCGRPRHEGLCARERLTSRQRTCVDFIRAYMLEHGSSPTNREIAAHMGISSTNGVADHLKAIERKGWISRRPLVARSIRLLDEPDLLAEANARAELWEKRARALGWSDPNRIKPP